MRSSFQKRILVSGLTALSLMMLNAEGTVRSDDGATSPAPQATAAIRLPLSEKIPEGLGFEDFEELGDSWSEWSEQTATLITELYEESEDAASQQARRSALRERLRTMQHALEDPRYGLIHETLNKLVGKLQRRLDLYDALDPILSADYEKIRSSRRKIALAGLESSLAKLKTTLGEIPGGERWLPYVLSKQLEEIAASGVTDADAIKVLKEVQSRLSVTAELAPEQRSFLQHSAFDALRTAVDRTLIAASIDTAEAFNKELLSAVESLLSGVEAYEQTGSREAASSVRSAYHNLDWMTGGNIELLSKVMRIYYFNYNLKIAASEGFLSRFINESRTESGAINEYVMEVYVSGCQWTTSKITVDVKPSHKHARFNLILEGDVTSNTTGEVHSAKVYNTGTAKFRAEKEIFLSEGGISTSPARVGVAASNCTYDAETCFEWLPIARKLARKYALNEANRKKPESDAYARRKIGREVRHRFDREVDQKFADAHAKMNAELYEPLKQHGLYPDLLSMSSTENDILVRSRLMNDAELAGTKPPAMDIPNDGVLLQIHQSLMNNGVDRFDFAGEKLTQAEVDEKIQKKLQSIFPNREIKPRERKEESATDNTRLLFDTVDPISFSFQNGVLTMSLRAGLEQPGEEDIPTQIISVPLAVHVEGDQIIMERGSVGVKPVQRPKNVREQIVRAQIMRSRIESTIPERQTHDAKMEIEQEGKKVNVQVRSITVSDGWLSLTVQ